jgi:hypothetical protein
MSALVILPGAVQAFTPVLASSAPLVALFGPSLATR